MSRFLRPLLVVFALATFASFARADSLRLVAPANGTTLHGGSFATLRWSATQLPASAEEWEAFLSVDGGRYYAFRITPHLDIDLHGFTFVVPNVDTRNARILIRTGNEAQETHYETRAFFSIVRDPNAGQATPLLRFGHGEAARDGDPAVLSWADGARNGAGLRQEFATNTPAQALRRLGNVPSEDLPPVIAPAANRINPPSAAVTLASVEGLRIHHAACSPLVPDLLLVCSRWNI
jgi:hypothetical protein